MVVVYFLHMNSESVRCQLLAAGWELKRTRGSHNHFKHPDFKYLITLPHPKKNLSIGVIKDIERKSGLKLRK